MGGPYSSSSLCLTDEVHRPTVVALKWIGIYCDVPGSPCLSKKGPVYGPFFFHLLAVLQTKTSA